MLRPCAVSFAEQPLSLENDVTGHEDCDQFVPALPGPVTDTTIDLAVLVLAEKAA